MLRLIVPLGIAVFGTALIIGQPAIAQQVVQGHVQAPPLIQIDGLEKGETQPRLQSAKVSIDASGSFTRTTLLLTLHNPNARILEGTLQFPLQPGQQVTGFALDIDGAMRDAVPVPKNKGQQVFEDIERRRVDPALLEQTAGNHFRLRIYPLPPHGTRQVKLVVDEAMRRDGDAWRMAVPVQLLAGAESFDLQVRAPGVRTAPSVHGSFDAISFRRMRGGYAAEVRRDAFRSGMPLTLDFPAADSPQVYTASFADARHFLAEIPLPQTAQRPRAIPDSIGLLWDASASARKRDRDSEFALLDRYFRAMGNGRVTLRLLRDVGEDAGTYEIRDGDWTTLRKALESAVRDGASNLSDWSPQAGIGEYLLVSDGLQNYGDGAFPQLQPGQRLYALSSAGAQADAIRLAGLADARGGRLIAWQGRAGLEAAGKALLEEGVRVAELRGEGVSDLQTQSIHPEGGLLRVAGRMSEPSAVLHVSLEADGTPLRTLDVPISADAPEAPQAAQLWASWRVEALSTEPDANRATITRLGQEYGLVTPGTSLLVLEAAEDYVTYDIREIPPRSKSTKRNSTSCRPPYPLRRPAPCRCPWTRPPRRSRHPLPSPPLAVRRSIASWSRALEESDRMMIQRRPPPRSACNPGNRIPHTPGGCAPPSPIASMRSIWTSATIMPTARHSISTSPTCCWNADVARKRYACSPISPNCSWRTAMSCVSSDTA